jgi:hypothetical protein
VWLMLVAVLAACTTGPISLGNDADCEPQECGTDPGVPPMCLDGSSGRYLCERDASEGCGWVALCPVVRCRAADCGVAPMESPMCPMSVWGLAWACEANQLDGCRWTPVCPEEQRECPLNDCGMAPADATECSSLGMEGSGCLLDAGGTCRWTAVACRGG